jgi:predicted signal transduction protein with EAL and GGDEF domain/response regulator RpfG family c-di-GMP phosphodiesterase
MMSNQINFQDDVLEIVDESGAEPAANRGRPWRILVVDDDEDVHESTRFVLKGVDILDRPLELLHAHSVAEAHAIMSEHGDVAVALVDVVMETPDAGLRLVRELREAGFHALRIILRTGQPGYAPEQSVIAAYEIDDYQTKAELTRVRLLTVLTAGIRAYEQIQTITRSRAGLEMIVDSAQKLFQRTNLELFGRGLLTQITALLGVEPNGIVCATGRGDPNAGTRIIVAAGRFAHYAGKSLSDIADPAAQMLLREVRGRTEPVIGDGLMALDFCSDSGRELSVVIEADCEVSPADRALIKIFSANIAIGFENLALLEELDRLAYIDPVLDVPNFNAFEVALGTRLAPGTHNNRMALICVEHFPTIVADYGSRIANQLLRAIYEKLVDTVGEGLVVSRIGDSTFALLGDEGRISEETITAAFRTIFSVDGLEIVATATSMVIGLEGVEGETATIMRTANAALLHAKRKNRGCCVVYDTEMRAAVERRMVLQAALKQAVDNGEGFAVHMQPKVDLDSRAVIGAEALLRWSHNGTAVSPTEFIPLAESLGLTQCLTDFVVDSVGKWSARGADGKRLPISINLSMVDLNKPDFAQRLLSRVVAAGLAPGDIEFEITEGVAMNNSAWAIMQVQMLKEAGHSIALDDFGTGYSSLGHFNVLPVDTLKIDRCFVTPLEVRSAQRSLAAIVLSMTQTLKVGCVAEGIETDEQLQALMLLGCETGQGYLFGRPVPMEDFESQFLAPAVA